MHTADLNALESVAFSSDASAEVIDICNVESVVIPTIDLLSSAPSAVTINTPADAVLSQENLMSDGVTHGIVGSQTEIVEVDCDACLSTPSNGQVVCIDADLVVPPLRGSDDDSDPASAIPSTGAIASSDAVAIVTIDDAEPAPILDQPVASCSPNRDAQAAAQTTASTVPTPSTPAVASAATRGVKTSRQDSNSSSAKKSKKEKEPASAAAAAKTPGIMQFFKKA